MAYFSKFTNNLQTNPSTIIKYIVTWNINNTIMILDDRCFYDTKYFLFLVEIFFFKSCEQTYTYQYIPRRPRVSFLFIKILILLWYMWYMCHTSFFEYYTSTQILPEYHFLIMKPKDIQTHHIFLHDLYF